MKVFSENGKSHENINVNSATDFETINKIDK